MILTISSNFVICRLTLFLWRPDPGAKGEIVIFLPGPVNFVVEEDSILYNLK
jgi:hypothetical protein